MLTDPRGSQSVSLESSLTTTVRSLCRKPAVRTAMGWANSTLYKRIQDRLFVPPIKIGLRVAVWPSDEITALQDAYVAGLPEAEIRSLVASLIAARGEKQ